MHTPDSHGPTPNGSPGYETTDVNVSGILLFLVSLAVFVAVFFVFCFGMGKVINDRIVKHDGPLNRWNAVPGENSHGLQNLASNAAVEQEQLNRMTQRFPMPRLQIDDGDQEVADLHAREDLLLDNYSWVDRQQGTVRIPIALAMQLIAQRGLPQAPEVQAEPLLTGDKAPHVSVPLTDGFARTGFEQQMLETMAQQRERGDKPGDQAALGR